MTKTITLSDLARELGVEQSPAQPYGPADFFASYDDTLAATYGTLSDDTAISAEDADAIRESFAQGVTE